MCQRISKCDDTNDTNGIIDINSKRVGTNDTNRLDGTVELKYMRIERITQMSQTKQTAQIKNMPAQMTQKTHTAQTR